MSLCHCGSAAEFSVCCAPALEGRPPAQTAEALMRARYSAYVARNIDFLISSTLPASRHESNVEAMQAWAEQAEWDGLEIVSTQKGLATDSQGEVEFIARFRLQGTPHHHHERSQFQKKDGLWYFKDGKVLYSGPDNKPAPVVNPAKAGRNDPCPCGSGKKFKKCCSA
jgi:SEC-C motif-containing protein